MSLLVTRRGRMVAAADDGVWRAAFARTEPWASVPPGIETIRPERDPKVGPRYRWPHAHAAIDVNRT